jgi:cytochrome c oxidase cbb3-type subunit 3
MTTQTRHDPIQGAIIHEYDGIEEADNKLPQWWLWTFYLAIAFALGYWVYYESVGIGRSPLDRFAAERMAALDTGAPVTDEVLVGLTGDKLAIRSATKAFGQNCAKCHGSRAEGNIGPNLTDSFWIGEPSPTAIYATITGGRSGKGMPAWGLQLGPGLCKQLAAYVLTLRDTNVPGKAPQGQKWPAGLTPSRAAPATGSTEPVPAPASAGGVKTAAR